jgi:hypothetical protein
MAGTVFYNYRWFGHFYFGPIGGIRFSDMPLTRHIVHLECYVRQTAKEPANDTINFSLSLLFLPG